MVKQKKSRRRQPEKEYSLYCIEIQNWDMNCSFSLNDRKLFGPGPYTEYTSLKLTGTFFQPEKIAGKDIVLRLYGDRDLTKVLNSPEKYPNASAKAIGVLTVRGKRREYSGSLPMDTFPVLSSLFSAERVKYVIMLGHALYRGSASIHSINFEQIFEEDDW